MVTKHTFEAIADSLYFAADFGKDRDTIDYVARGLCEVLRSENPRFDFDRFMDRVKTGPFPYVVIHNVPGYMPEDEPELFESRRDAEQYAVSIADHYRDMGYHVSGSAKSGRYDVSDGRVHDLGRVIEILDRRYL